MINIVGGTYKEFCFEPYWNETFGSGLRACLCILSLNAKEKIRYSTFADEKTSQFLKNLESHYENFSIDIGMINQTTSFYYDHPLIIPTINPRPDTIEKSSNVINVEAENIIYYGTIEGKAQIKGTKVVYDPQSPANPQSFLATGSIANQLIVIVNYSEAKIISKSKEISIIKEYFFTVEKVHALILKMGAQGAFVFTQENQVVTVPVFKTNSVWPIGSGDIFAANFAYNWFQGRPIIDAAMDASLATAIYCNSRVFPSVEPEKTSFNPLIINKPPSKQIYLAGPFFTFSERWLIEQVRTALNGMGIQVFSPFHDVGYGLAQDVVYKDLKGLEESGLVLAILDGLDSGTLFEVGYAISKKIPVVAYVQNETNDSIKMLEGTGCTIVSDLSTAIYKSYWALAENE